MAAETRSEGGAVAAEVFLLHIKIISRWLLRWGVRRQDLADALQEVFLAILERGQAFERRSAVLTWILSIGRNVAGNQLRREARDTRSAADSAFWEPSAEGLYEAEEERALLRRAVVLIDPDSRTVVESLDLQERPYSETAKKIGVRVPTLRVRRCRAHKELAREVRRQLKGKAGDITRTLGGLRAKERR